MIIFLHILGILFGVAAIGCAAIAVMNMLQACVFPEDMINEAWPYMKKSYIFLGLTLLFGIIGTLLSLT